MASCHSGATGRHDGRASAERHDGDSPTGIASASQGEISELLKEARASSAPRPTVTNICVRAATANRTLRVPIAFVRRCIAVRRSRITAARQLPKDSQKPGVSPPRIHRGPPPAPTNQIIDHTRSSEPQAELGLPSINSVRWQAPASRRQDIAAAATIANECPSLRAGNHVGVARSACQCIGKCRKRCEHRHVQSGDADQMRYPVRLKIFLADSGTRADRLCERDDHAGVLASGNAARMRRGCVTRSLDLIARGPAKRVERVLALYFGT